MSVGQSTPQILEAGDAYFERGDFLGASKVYQKAMRVDSSDASVLYSYAKSLMELNQMERAARYFFKASLIDRGENYPDVYYLLAEAYRGNGDYRKARRYYTKALIPYRRDRNSYWYKRIDQSKEANSWAMKHAASDQEALSPFDPQFNTEASEFAPRVINGQLYFSSLRADSILADQQVLDQHYFSRLFQADWNKKEAASPISISKKESKLARSHLANISLDKKGEVVFFSVCDTNYQCEIFKGEITENHITNVSKLNKNINYPGTNNTQAEYVSRSGKNYLIFSSNRPRGFGGMDLWVSEEQDFGFDQAINLGADVNSEGNEITPFYLNGWLYFSSDWHLGFGGYDIFKSEGWLSRFSEIKNLGQPFNSPADDYYFNITNDLALISSNRKQENNTDYCCNDIYFGQYEEEIVEADTLVPDLITLNKYLPMDLYFHNDVPDPRSRDSTTQANYVDLAQEFLLMREEYDTQLKNVNLYVKDDEMALQLESFFEEDIPNGLADLEFFTPLLLQSLEAGNQIQLTIKGFASSLSGEDYNLNLTLRRINSLVNYFEAYENGIFGPYLKGSAVNGGSLKIQKLPFGEFAISDKSLEEDQILAVYSPQAARQRKIELIAVSMEEGSQKTFDSEQTYSPAKIEFNSRLYELGEVEANEIERVFVVENTGSEKLTIYNIMINCEACAQIEYPSELAGGEDGRIEVRLDLEQIKGTVQLTLTVVSNTVPHLNELNIKLTK